MTDDLDSGDRALLNAASYCNDVVELTPALMTQLQAALTERTDKISVEHPKLISECSYETKLAITAWVFEQLCAHAATGGSFRYLIYERMGFGPDAYVPLYLAGGMLISNEFDLSKETTDQHI